MKIKLPSDIPTHARCANCQQLVPVESMVEDNEVYICRGCFDAVYQSEPANTSVPTGALTAVMLAIGGVVCFWWGIHSIGLYIILSIGLFAGSVLQAVEMRRASKLPSGRLARLAANSAFWLSVSMMANMLLYMSISFVRFLQHPC